MSDKSLEQEWTPDWLANFGSAENWLEQVCDAHKTELSAKQRYIDEIRTTTYSDLEKQLAAERQRREQAERDYRISLNAEKQITDGLGKLNDDLHQQLLSAQAAIEELHDALVAASSEFNLAGTEATARKINKALEVYPDLSLLHRHVAEARKPLVDALESIAANTCCDKCQEAALVAKTVLAKVKQ